MAQERRKRDDAEEASLWCRLKEGGDQAAADELARKYLPLAQMVAGRVLLNLPSTVDRDAVASASQFGLAEAIRRFDPGRGLKFVTYAPRLISGRIIDDLRNMAIESRSTRNKQKAAEEERGRLSQDLGRRPSTEECDQAGASARPLTVHSLHSHVYEMDSGDFVALKDLLAGRADKDPHVASLERIVEIKGLNKRERYMLLAYFVFDHTMQKTAKALGVSESRVSQLMKALCERLRERGDEVRETLTSE